MRSSRLPLALVAVVSLSASAQAAFDFAALTGGQPTATLGSSAHLEGFAFTASSGGAVATLGLTVPAGYAGPGAVTLTPQIDTLTLGNTDYIVEGVAIPPTNFTTSPLSLTIVPEPATWVLAVFALMAGLLVWRRRCPSAAVRRRVANTPGGFAADGFREPCGRRGTGARAKRVLPILSGVARAERAWRPIRKIVVLW